MVKSSLFDFEAELVRETEKAYMLQVGVDTVWVPKSATELGPPDVHGLREVTIPLSLAHEKGLV